MVNLCAPGPYVPQYGYCPPRTVIWVKKNELYSLKGALLPRSSYDASIYQELPSWNKEVYSLVRVNYQTRFKNLENLGRGL